MANSVSVIGLETPPHAAGTRKEAAKRQREARDAWRTLPSGTRKAVLGLARDGKAHPDPAVMAMAKAASETWLGGLRRGVARFLALGIAELSCVWLVFRLAHRPAIPPLVGGVVAWLCVLGIFLVAARTFQDVLRVSSDPNAEVADPIRLQAASDARPVRILWLARAALVAVAGVALLSGVLVALQPRDHGATSTGALAIGTPIALRNQDGQSLEVTLISVDYGAVGATRAVRAHLRMANTSSNTLVESPVAASKVIDQQGNAYPGITSPTGDCRPPLPAIEAADKTTGCIAFSVPLNASIVKFAFTPSAGFASVKGLWTVA